MKINRRNKVAAGCVIQVVSHCTHGASAPAL